MGLIDMVLDAYGIKSNPTAAKGLADSGDSTLCATNEPACLAALHKSRKDNAGMSSMDGDDRIGEQRWVDMHEAVLRRSHLDKNISRWQMIWTLYKALPKWVKVVLFILLIIGFLLAFIPGFMILVEVLSSTFAMFKISVLLMFALVVMIGFPFLPM